MLRAKWGGDDSTYRKRSFDVETGEDVSGGSSMWQLDPAGFDDTQDIDAHPGLPAKWKIIEDEIGIDWEKVKFDDLDIPLIGAIAVRLFLMNIPLKNKKTGEVYGPLPALLKAQGAYWKKHYNKSGRGTAAEFVKRVEMFSGSPLAGTGR